MTTMADEQELEELLQSYADQKVKAKAKAKKLLKSIRHEYRCSFCDKGQSKVQKIITGPDGLCICNECVVLCAEILLEQGEREKKVERVKRFSATLAERV